MRGQASMELLITIGIVLAFTIPVVFLLLSLTMVGYEDTSIAQADATARSLADSINVVHSQGPGAKRMVLMNLPSNTDSLSIKNNEVVVAVKTSKGSYEAAAPFFANADNIDLLRGGERGGLVQFEIGIVENSDGEVEAEVGVFEED